MSNLFASDFGNEKMKSGGKQRDPHRRRYSRATCLRKTLRCFLRLFPEYRVPAIGEAPTLDERTSNYRLSRLLRSLNLFFRGRAFVLDVKALMIVESFSVAKGVLDEDGVPDRSKSLNRIVTFSQKDEVVAAIITATLSGNHGSARFSSKRHENSGSSSSGSSEEEEEDSTVAQRTSHVGAHKRRVTVDVGAQKNGSSVMGSSYNIEDDLGISSVPNGLAGEQVAAGWPSWLTDVAGEAINGWLPRRGDSFEKLDKIGEGTYSHVFRARDLLTGKIVALKKVRFVNMDPESVRFMAREIHILRRLDHPNVIKLEGIITSRMSCNLYLIFEYMEHDLAGLAARSSVRFTEPQVKCYVKQLLEGLDHCHSRGVLHRDIKGSNLLIDNSGILRLADFGLATLLTVDQNQQLTSRVVTLWYRPPELLLGATEYGAAVDLWSSGCILAELYAGRPIMPGRTEVEQLHKIFKLCGSPSEEYWEKSKLPHATIFKPQHQYRRCLAETFKDFPPSALSLLDYLLAIEPEKRGTAASALQSVFFTTMPFACDSSSLPKYPPSKEYDAKLQDEARRQRTAARGRASESVRPQNRGSRAMPAQERQNPHGYLNTKSISKKYDEQDDAASGFPMEPPGGPSQNVFSHSGMHPNALGSTLSGRKQQQARHAPSRTYSSMRVPNGLQLRPQMSYRPHLGGADFSDISGSFAARGNAGSGRSQLDGGRHAEQKKDDIVIAKEPAQVYGHRARRIHYSGPLMPPGGNMEDMLKEHEKQIQQAVRKSRRNF